MKWPSLYKRAVNWQTTKFAIFTLLTFKDFILFRVTVFLWLLCCLKKKPVRYQIFQKRALKLISAKWKSNLAALKLQILEICYQRLLQFPRRRAIEWVCFTDFFSSFPKKLSHSKDAMDIRGFINKQTRLKVNPS